jgi:2-C-methyl-D-erythritol 4-phosphate cytidylyltransferase
MLIPLSLLERKQHIVEFVFCVLCFVNIGKIAFPICRPFFFAFEATEGFWLDDILTAHNNALTEGRDDYIDSCSIMKHYGHRLHMIVGPAENIKITTPEDFYIMRAFIEAKENAQMYMPEEQ